MTIGCSGRPIIRHLVAGGQHSLRRFGLGQDESGSQRKNNRQCREAEMPGIHAGLLWQSLYRQESSMSRSKGASTGHFLSAQPSRPKKTWAYLCIDLISDRAVLFLVPLRI